MSDERVQLICNGLGRWYRSLNREYDAIFSNFFDENGYDEETIEDDYTQGDPLSLSSIDFARDDDDQFDFPFGKESPSTELKKAIFIWDIIKKIDADPSIKFDPTAPKYNQEYFKINDEKEIEAIKDKYKKQCPAIYHQGLNNDTGMLYILAITAKHKNDYILHLVDDFSRHRIQNIDNKAYTEVDWISNHPHFNKTKLIKTQPADKDKKNNKNQANLPGNYADLIRASVASFGKRCCAQLLLNNTKVINDSIKNIVAYMVSAITFVKEMIDTSNKMRKGVCPFIVDFCWATGEPEVKSKEEKDESDDEDDDQNEQNNQEEKPGYVDLIGDIPAKLKKNNLKHMVTGYNFDDPPEPEEIERIFTKSFNEFKGNELDEEKAFMYPFNKRIIAFVDRRKSRNNKEIADAVYMFEPPSKKYTHNIPNDPVSLWGISASKTCLLPNINYDEKDAIGEPNTNKLNMDQDEKNKDPQDINIGATYHCKNGLLTMSIIAKNEKVIKCYLFYGGGVIRFFPRDIKIVFPTIFNMDYKGNRDYIENDKELDNLIKKMTDQIVDEEFSKFQQYY